MKLGLVSCSQYIGSIFLVYGEYSVLFNAFATENIYMLFLTTPQLLLLVNDPLARKTDLAFTFWVSKDNHTFKFFVLFEILVVCYRFRCFLTVFTVAVFINASVHQTKLCLINDSFNIQILHIFLLFVLFTHKALGNSLAQLQDPFSYQTRAHFNKFDALYVFDVDEPGYSSDINKKVHHNLLDSDITIDGLKEIN